MLIGRKEEQARLREAYASQYSEFVAVYGRRRVGKTFLVRETFDYRFAFEHAGLAHADMKSQLQSWRSSLIDCGLRDCPLPTNWLDAFDQLKSLIRGLDTPKKVIFIDEMPWMDTHRSGFVTALEHFWNGWASGRKDVLLIICGSATSWIINKVIRNHGGLHNRVSMKINVKPFTLHECMSYAQSQHLAFSHELVLQAYMIFGGIPYYWKCLDRHKSLAQNIDALIYHSDGELYNEFDQLYASLFRHPEQYLAVIAALGTIRAGMTRDEIIKHAHMADNGNLTHVLNDLESCGFIRRYCAYGMKNKHAVYQLIDFYTIFYYKMVAGLDRQDKDRWLDLQQTPAFNTWCGLAFERVCMAHVPQLKAALGIAGVSTSIYVWSSRHTEHTDGRGCQIDLVIERRDQTIDLCEMKYSKGDIHITADDYRSVLNKQETFRRETRTKSALHNVLVASSAVARNAYSDEFQHIITLDQLFKD